MRLTLACALFLCANGWKQDRFAISIWVDPVVPPEEFPARYAEMRRANISVLLGGFGATTPETVAASLQACEQNGLMAIVSTCGGGSGGSGGGDGDAAGTAGACVNSNSTASSSLWGFQLKDEPAATEFPGLSQWSEAVAEAAPGALRFINLLPNYATPEQMNASTYDEYVGSFVSTVKPDVLCMDSYPFFEIDPVLNPSINITTEGYHRNLAVLRAHALAAGINFWNFFNAMPFNSHLAPTEGQIAWQAFTSLAYGAKGVLYFTYWSPGFGGGGVQRRILHRSLEAASAAAASASAGIGHYGDAFQKGGGLVSPVSLGIDGALAFTPTAQYASAQRVNALLMNFGSVLLNSLSVATWRPHMGEAPAGCPIISLNETDAAGKPGAGTPQHGAYLVGVFRDEPGGQQNDAAAAAASASATKVLIVNQRHDIELWPTVALAANINVSQVREIDEVTGEARLPIDDSPQIPGLQLALRPGYARLLLVMVPPAL